MENPRGMKRIFRRIREELRATVEIAKATSLWDGAVTFLGKAQIQIMNRNGFREPAMVRKLLLKKHDVMLEYFEKTLPAASHWPVTSAPCELGSVWLCWWQGEEAMPEIVKACIASVRAHVKDRRVILITEENYGSYVSIPDWAVEKFRRGILSPTHFSDILRLHLLAEYGGIWLDASMFCTATPEEWSLPLWSIKRPGYLHCSVAAGSFATYGMGCRGEMRWIFVIFRDRLLTYWKKKDFLVDYLLLDYLMVLARNHCSAMETAFRAVPPNQPNCDELCKVLGEPFDEKRWMQMKQDTCLFKLTWKQRFPREKNGKLTFYAMLLEGKL